MLVLALVAVAAIATVRLLGHKTASPAIRAVAIREPVPAWSDVDRARLRAEVRDALAPAIGEGATYSFAIVDADGRMLYGDHAGQTLTPASVQKLVIADAALSLLGPNYRFFTIFAAPSSIRPDGVLPGDLEFVGSGDPSLRSNDVRRGIERLSASGLREIDGGIRIDDFALEGPEINPHWSPDDAGEDYQTPTSAVSLDGDTVEFRVYGESPGMPARIVTIPPSDAVRVEGSVTSATEDNVVIDPDAGGVTNAFAFSGSIPAGSEEKFWMPLAAMPAYDGSVIARMLSDAHVTHTGAIQHGRAGLTDVVLWQHRSAPLRALVARMLFVSDNHYAEQLLRTVGGENGRPDDASGIATETALLRSRGVPVDGVRLYDGSGLARANRVSAAMLARILADADLYPFLPQGGRDGTLKHYDFTTALGRVRAKTGHMSGVSSLAGYVNTRHHGRIAFAFMINDSPGDADGSYVSAVDRLAGL